MKSIARLIILRDGKAEDIDLGEGLSIGRSSKNDLVLNDNNTSRRHADIRRVEPTRFVISDLGSANGTWINDRRLAAPQRLHDGDTIVIGESSMTFVGPAEGMTTHTGFTTHTRSTSATSVSMRNESVIVLVADIRNYTGMSETLPSKAFSRLITDWNGAVTAIIEGRSGILDKFIGDAVMAYWVLADAENPTEEVASALVAARKITELAQEFSERVSSEFTGHSFAIGMGLNLGEAIFGNVGTGDNPSFTIIGDSVNVAFRLEALSKSKGHTVVVSQAIVDHASKWFRFRPLGRETVKGRTEPLTIAALKL